MPSKAALQSTEGPVQGHGRFVWLTAGLVILVAGMAALYALTNRNVSTDNAYVQIAQLAVNSNVSGQVIEVAVGDNQHVRRGDVLIRLDDRQLRSAVSEAHASLDSAQAGIAAEKAAYLQKQVELAAARERFEYKNRLALREQEMRTTGAVSVQRLEDAQDAAEQARAEVDSLRHQVAGLLAALSGNPDGPVEQYPAVQLARAKLEQAQMAREFATISAPFDGFVARTETVQIGSYVSASKPIFALFSDSNAWIEANFKEAQLAKIRVGQSAEVSIDRCPGRLFKATVVSISRGTGASFSILPAENATGNWVKVAQRLPVRLEFRETPPLELISSGLSATVTIVLTGN